MAIDYGEKRTGIAESDDLGTIAFGLTTIATANLHHFLNDYMRNNKVVGLVIGWPMKWDGSTPEIASNITQFIKEVNVKYPSLPTYKQDERFTSKIAAHSLILSGVKKKKRQQKELVDEVSATLILQSFLQKHTT